MFIKTEYAGRSFSLTGAKEFNMLPLQAREMTAPNLKSFLKKHFRLIVWTNTLSTSFRFGFLGNFFTLIPLFFLDIH